MQVDLYCPHCSHRFRTPSVPRLGVALEQVSDEGPWCALGDGETLEDHIFATLTAQGPIPCPACGESVPIEEESVVELAQELLAQW